MGAVAVTAMMTITVFLDAGFGAAANGLSLILVAVDRTGMGPVVGAHALETRLSYTLQQKLDQRYFTNFIALMFMAQILENITNDDAGHAQTAYFETASGGGLKEAVKNSRHTDQMKRRIDWVTVTLGIIFDKKDGRSGR